MTPLTAAQRAAIEGVLSGVDVQALQASAARRIDRRYGWARLDGEQIAADALLKAATGFDPRRSGFRARFHVVLWGLVKDELDKANAMKRGGGLVLLPFNFIELPRRAA